MNTLTRHCAAALMVVVAAEPVLTQSAWACATREDELALQAANVQQRLMVAALTCHDVDAYNRFVITYRRELQDSDAALLAFFQKGSSGTAGYHAYKTRLANASELNSLNNDDFCRDADHAFHSVLASGDATLADALATLPPSDTGFDACYRREAETAQPAVKDWHW
jgi:uncharacterized protein YeaO (DUF488 family)